MSELITPDSLIEDINLNYRRLNESRVKEEPNLEGLFEARMNRALDQYSDMIKFSGKVALA